MMLEGKDFGPPRQLSKSLHFKVVSGGGENYKLMITVQVIPDNYQSKEREISPQLSCTTSNTDEMI